MYNVAYTRYVLDKGKIICRIESMAVAKKLLLLGVTGDQLDLQVAMAPCLLGYGEIGLMLYNDPNTKRGKKTKKDASIGSYVH